MRKESKEETEMINRWRKEVVTFADAMEAKLRANDHKSHWSNADLQYLSMRLTQEREELRRAVENGDPDEVLKEAADVANFAMMVADKVRRDYKVRKLK
jgi:NTP pyrophosphatase (non-canonical NTP hydrolase)